MNNDSLFFLVYSSIMWENNNFFISNIQIRYTLQVGACIFQRVSGLPGSSAMRLTAIKKSRLFHKRLKKVVSWIRQLKED